MRTPSGKYRNVYSYPVQGGRKWGAVADHGLVAGRRRRVRREGFTRERAAYDWLIAELAAGPASGAVASDLTLGGWVERWLALRATELAWGTVEGYRYALGIFSGLFGHRLADVGVADIELALAGARARYKPNTLRQARRVLSACLNAAVAMDLRADNPVRRTKPVLAGRERRRYLDATQVRALLAVSGADPRWALPVRLLAETWIRLGELQALRWADVDGAAIRIERTAVDSERGYVLGATTKSLAAVRTVPIGAELARLLTMARDRDRFEVGDRWHDGLPVCPGADGGLLERDGLRHALERFCRAAGLPLTTPHGLRHAGASIAIAAGLDPKLVSQRLGHATVAFTLDRYTHPNADDHRRAADLVSELLGTDSARIRATRG